MTIYIPTLQDTTKVGQNDLNLAWENNYQNFSRIFSSQGVPYIKQGLKPSIDGAGLVTVTTGVFLGTAFLPADNALLPVTGMNIVNLTTAPLNLVVPAVAPEWGHIVMRESLVIVNGLDAGNAPIQVGLDVPVTLVYVPGGATSYPAVALHDTVVVGVKTTGAGPFAYELDFSQRVQDTEVYNTSTLQNQLWGDPDFLFWMLDLSAPTTVSAGTTVQISSSWFLESEVVDVDVSREDVSTANMLIIEGAPSTSIRIVQTVGAALAKQFLYQKIPSLTSIANRWVNVSFYETFSAGAVVTFTLEVRQDATVLFTSAPQVIPVSASFQQVIKDIFIPIDLANVQSSDSPVHIGIVINGDSTNYQLDAGRVSITSGKTFQPVQSRVGAKSESDLFKTLINNTALTYTDSGVADAYILNLKGGLTNQIVNEYFEGLEVKFIALVANTGASTAQIGGLAPIAITDIYGDALEGLNIVENLFSTLTFKSGVWVLTRDPSAPLAAAFINGGVPSVGLNFNVASVVRRGAPAGEYQTTFKHPIPATGNVTYAQVDNLGPNNNYVYSDNSDGVNMGFDVVVRSSGPNSLADGSFHFTVFPLRR